jgi:hypothetical protein
MFEHLKLIIAIVFGVLGLVIVFAGIWEGIEEDWSRRKKLFLGTSAIIIGVVGLSMVQIFNGKAEISRLVPVFAMGIVTLLLNLFGIWRQEKYQHRIFSRLTYALSLWLAVTPVIFLATRFVDDKKEASGTTAEIATIRAALEENRQNLDNSLESASRVSITAKDLQEIKADSIVLAVAQSAYDSTIAVFNSISLLDSAIARDRKKASRETMESVLQNVFALRRALVKSYDSAAVWIPIKSVNDASAANFLFSSIIEPGHFLGKEMVRAGDLINQYWTSNDWNEQRLSLALIQHGILTEVGNYIEEFKGVVVNVNNNIAKERPPTVVVNSESLAPGQDLLITLTPPEGVKAATVSFNGVSMRSLENGDYQYSEKVKKPGRGKVEILMVYQDANADLRSFKKTVTYLVSAHAQSKPKEKSASMGYSYPYNIKRNATRNINVYVTVHHPESAAKDTILRTLAEQKVMVSGTDSDVVEVISIPVYQKIGVWLIDPDSLFHKTRIDDEVQVIDAVHGNHWRWTISTSTDRPSGTLVLKTHTFGPNGRFKDKNIVIPVVIDNEGYFRRLWIYLLDNPALLITLLILPVLAYFGKRLLDRK